MIISKKKFERMVEEECAKRMIVADKQRWQDERLDRIAMSMDTQFTKVWEHIGKLEETLRDMNSNKHKCCDEKLPMMFRF